MFFSISDQPKNNFPNCYHLGKFCVSTDAGWHTADFDGDYVVYKGYVDQGTLDQQISYLVQQTVPTVTGNFCAIVYNKNSNTISVKTDKYRSFPLYYDSHKQITNLEPFDNIIWANQVLTMDADFNIELQKFNVIGQIDTSVLEYDTVIQRVDEILSKKVQEFIKHNSLPVRVFLSGGVDTMLVYSYLKRFNADIELIRGSFFEWDYFWLKNSGDIEKYWGYQQIHHWTNDCVLSSGAPGDEFMLRSPGTADLYLKHHGIKILELLQQHQWKNCLHARYFDKEKFTKIFQTQQSSAKNNVHLHWTLCNNVVNDWQHWHLGKTLTWTPLRDLEIFKLMLRLPMDAALQQIFNSELSLKLIENNSPGLSQHISDYKNSDNLFSNLVGLVI
jgi:hypothetical protein